MKVIERIALIIFSDIVLVLSILACILIFGWLDYDVVSDLVQKLLTAQLPSQIILAVCIAFILLALRCIFFSTSEKEDNFKNGILLENEKGKLMITKETLQNLANSVAKSFGRRRICFNTCFIRQRKQSINIYKLNGKTNSSYKRHIYEYTK